MPLVLVTVIETPPTGCPPTPRTTPLSRFATGRTKSRATSVTRPMPRSTSVADVVPLGGRTEKFAAPVKSIRLWPPAGAVDNTLALALQLPWASDPKESPTMVADGTGTPDALTVLPVIVTTGRSMFSDVDPLTATLVRDTLHDEFGATPAGPLRLNVRLTLPAGSVMR